MFIAALFTIARTWKQPRRQLADDWIRKLWYITQLLKRTHLTNNQGRRQKGKFALPNVFQRKNAFESVLMR